MEFQNILPSIGTGVHTISNLFKAKPIINNTLFLNVASYINLQKQNIWESNKILHWNIGPVTGVT